MTDSDDDTVVLAHQPGPAWADNTEPGERMQLGARLLIVPAATSGAIRVEPAAGVEHR